MSIVKTGCCPTCGKDKQLCYIKFGVIQATMCPVCLHKYLEVCIIPRVKDLYDTSADDCQISNGGVVIGGFLKNE